MFKEKPEGWWSVASSWQYVMESAGSCENFGFCSGATQCDFPLKDHSSGCKNSPWGDKDGRTVTS